MTIAVPVFIPVIVIVLELTKSPRTTLVRLIKLKGSGSASVISTYTLSSHVVTFHALS